MAISSYHAKPAISRLGTGDVAVRNLKVSHEGVELRPAITPVALEALIEAPDVGLTRHRKPACLVFEMKIEVARRQNKAKGEWVIGTLAFSNIRNSIVGKSLARASTTSLAEMLSIATKVGCSTIRASRLSS
ncbi:hypothetical protein [Mesorhizobium sp. M0895]|uniref:hypothetical protein n=1 Tax=Mesorhizobium sp. M0895 TaxID=2957019 RepID=UPI00333774AF